MTDVGERRETHISVDVAGANAVDLLQQATGLSKQAIKLAMNRGAVWLTRGKQTRRLRRAKRVLADNDELHLYYDPVVLQETPSEPALIADTGGYSVWRKPFGLRSQGSKWGDHCTVVRWAEQHLEPERPGFTVHRLDRAANGLMLVAHSKTVAAALSLLFKERQVDKCYRAIVAGNLSAGPETRRIDEPIDGKEAVSELRFLQLDAEEKFSLVDIRIETGRKHQIRRHLAAIDHPVRGDRLYGTDQENGVDLQLTAYLLAFQCPVQDIPVTYQLADEWLPTLDAAE